MRTCKEGDTAAIEPCHDIWILGAHKSFFRPVLVAIQWSPVSSVCSELVFSPMLSLCDKQMLAYSLVAYERTTIFDESGAFRYY